VVKSPPTFAHIARTEFQTRVQLPGPSLKLGSGKFFLRFENCRCLDRVLNSAQYIWNRVLNSVPASCYYIIHPVHFFFIFLQLAISSKSSLLLLQELPTGKNYFSTDPESIRIHHSRLINVVSFFSIWTINFYCKIKIH
jgi:hypothetical protein